MSDKIIPGFPDIIGASRLVILDHTGPTSYTTGGETFPQNNPDWTLNGLGFYGLNAIGGSLVTADGLYRLLPQFSSGEVSVSVSIKWVVVSTGDEVAAGTDLSGSTARLIIIAV